MVPKSIRWISLFIIIAILIGSISIPVRTIKAASVQSGNCRFGLTAPNSLTGIDMRPLQAGAFLDWGAKPPSIPAGMEYIHVLLVGENCYDSGGNKVNCASLTPPQKSAYDRTLELINPPAPLKSIIVTNPGGFWIISNEPDTTYGTESLYADVYASRFFTIASRIRALDPTAKIGFGTIVQATPIRLRYLARAWDKLVLLAGSVPKASSLIDVWTIHGFMLNEVDGYWGTGVPLGFTNDHADAVVISWPFSDTYSISIFSNRIKNFRKWLNERGQRNKPLWITEYGSLFPPINKPGNNFQTVSDALTLQFMVRSFDFMMTAADPSTGMPLDNNHLVQSWFWYSLNEHRYTFGGSLFNIDNGALSPTLTTVGTAFMNYAPKDNIYSEFHFDKDKAPSLSIDPAVPSHLNISFRVANIGTSSRQAARVWVYRDEPYGTPLAVLETLPFQGCGDSLLYRGSIDYPASAEGPSKLYLRLDTDGDGVPHSNDEIVVLDAPQTVGLTAVARSRSRIRLDWTGSPNADSYRIEGSADGGKTWKNPTLTSVGKVTTTDMTGLTCGVSYQYRVRAYNSQGNWGSNVASARTDACTTPAISVLPRSQKRINLSWVNTLVTASGFKVQRSLNSSSGWQDIGTAPRDAVGYYSDYSDILIKSLACGTPYYYRIQPFNNNDGIPEIWSWSNTAYTSTKPCGPPPIPIPAANPHTSHSNVLTWIRLDDADTYQLERSLNGSTGWISLGSPLSQDTTRFLDKQAEPGITFYYHVRATNSYGDKGFSAAVPVQTYLYDFFIPFVLR